MTFNYGEFAPIKIQVMIGGLGKLVKPMGGEAVEILKQGSGLATAFSLIIFILFTRFCR